MNWEEPFGIHEEFIKKYLSDLKNKFYNFKLPMLPGEWFFKIKRGALICHIRNLNAELKITEIEYVLYDKNYFYLFDRLNNIYKVSGDNCLTPFHVCKSGLKIDIGYTETNSISTLDGNNIKEIKYLYLVKDKSEINFHWEVVHVYKNKLVKSVIGNLYK